MGGQRAASFLDFSVVFRHCDPMGCLYAFAGALLLFGSLAIERVSAVVGAPAQRSTNRAEAQTLDTLLAEFSPTDFGGVVADEVDGVVRVYYRDSISIDTASSIVDSALESVRTINGEPSAGYPALTIQFIPDSQTYDSFDRAARRLTAVQRRGPVWSRSFAATVTEFQTDYDARELVLGLALVGPQALAALEEFVGAERWSTIPPRVRVELRHRADVTSRQSDSASHFSGARIIGSNGLNCSSGFSVRTSTGAQRMLTAAHCGVVGTSWQNGNNTSSFGSTVASVPRCATAVASGCKDLALLSGSSYSGYMYVGNATSSTYTPVKSTFVPTGLQSVTVSGATAGDTSPYQFPITGEPSPICVNYGSGTTAGWRCGLRRITWISNGVNQFVQPGDSGGPIYIVQNSFNYHAVGIVSGRSTSSGYLYYTSINDALAWGAISLVTA